MKRFLCTLLCALLVLTAAPLTVFAAGSPPVIGLAAGAAEQDRAAAETLRQYLAQMLPTAPVLGAVTDADFIIGGVPEGEALPAGGYRITRQNGGAVSIAGAGSTGVQNGVYAFLRDYGGCRWYAPGEFLMPQTDALTLPDAIDESCAPYFEYSYTDWFSSRDTEFRAATGQTGNGSYIAGFCHTLATRFCARDKYFDEHPEYFALHGGKR
ncbi:MAG: hypothetical protein IKH12_01115, partial [Clostridia bacterium]|nr:hypothetical protein [Clostridia bacterium]